MFSHKFGVEVEFTGITRCQAAKVAAAHFGSTVIKSGDYYDTHNVTASDGRVWKFMSDSSIHCQRKIERQAVSASRHYSVEMVSPILTYYEDIQAVQELVRGLRKAGGFTNGTCGIHVHLDG